MKKNIILLLFFPFSFFIEQSFIQAQDSTNSNDMPDKISKIETTLSVMPKLSGYVNLRYQYNGSTYTNGFDVRRARLNFNGAIAKSVSYRVQVAVEGSPKLVDAYVNWKISDKIDFQVGQHKVPFSLENPYSPTALEMMDNSMVISFLSGYSDLSGVSSAGRDIGAIFNGSFLTRQNFNLIEYSVGIFNGAGINVADNNKSKDFAGTLKINPLKSLSLAVYHYNGSALISEVNIQRVRTGAGVKYDDGTWLMRSEYIKGRTGSRTSEGAYAVLGYFVHPQFQLLGKYDYFKNDVTISKDSRQNYTMAVNYFPVRKIRLQLNYIRNTFASLEDYDYIGTQLTAQF